MNCCQRPGVGQCQGIESVFDQKYAAKELESYRQKGPDKTTRILIDALTAAGVAGTSLLDIGGGVGVIQNELLKAGADRAVAVDASSGYLAAAKEEAERQGHSDRITYHYGDFVNLAPDIPPADVVTLDRVICCYHDVTSLVDLSAARARRYYGLVYPRDTWWMRMALPVLNAGFWLRRNPFRTFVHPTKSVEAIVHRHALKRRFYRKTFIWQIVVYERSDA